MNGSGKQQGHAQSAKEKTAAVAGSKQFKKPALMFLIDEESARKSPLQSPSGSSSSKVQFLQQSPRFQNSSLVQVKESNLKSLNPSEFKHAKDFLSSLHASVRECSSEQSSMSLVQSLLKNLLEAGEFQDFAGIVVALTPLRDFLKIRSAVSCQQLHGSLLPLFVRELSRKSLSSVEDLLKLSLLFSFEGSLVGVEKSIQPTVDLFTKMLQVMQEPSTVASISNGVQRQVLLNIQAICKGTSGGVLFANLQTELRLVFKRIQELILHFFTVKPIINSAIDGASLESPQFMRFLQTLLRTAAVVLFELKQDKTFLSDVNTQKLAEKVFLRVFKYIFLGSNVFHSTVFGGGSSVSTDGSSLTSAITAANLNSATTSYSEMSESDESRGGKSSTKRNSRVEESQAKIRHATVHLIIELLKDFPEIARNQWQLLIKSNTLTKEFAAAISTQSSRGYAILYPNFMEVSLLSSLLFEDQRRIQLNILSSLTALIESLPSSTKSLLQTFDVAKMNSRNKPASGFSTQSYLLYTALTNIHYALVYELQETLFSSVKPQQQILSADEGNPIISLSADELQYCSAITKVYTSLLTETQIYEKMPDESQQLSGTGIGGVVRILAVNVLRMSRVDTDFLHLKLATLQLLTALTKSATATSKCQEVRDFCQIKQKGSTEQNLFAILIDSIKQSIGGHNAGGGGVKGEQIDEQKDNLLDSIAIESIALLKHLYKNFQDIFLDTADTLHEGEEFPHWRSVVVMVETLESQLKSAQKCLSSHSKLLLLSLYELIEEIAVSLSESSTNDSDALTQSQLTQSVHLAHFNKQIFTSFLGEKVYDLLALGQTLLIHDEDSSSGIISSAFGLAAYLTNEQWKHSEKLQKAFVTTILNQQSQRINLRFSLLKILSAVSFSEVFTESPVLRELCITVVLRENDQKKESTNVSRQPSSKNNNLVISSKLAQTIANWCYNLTASCFERLPEAMLCDLINSILVFAGSAKEKIAPHGLRALGLMLKKVSQQTYRSLLPAVSEGKLCKLMNSALLHEKSPKIVWNACVAIANIYEGNHLRRDGERGSSIFSIDSFITFSRSLESVVNEEQNSKSTQYALSTLETMWKQINLTPSLLPALHSLLSTLITIGSNGVGDHSKEIALFMRLFRLLSDNNAPAEVYLVELINTRAYSIVSSLSRHLMDIYRRSGMEHIALSTKEHSQDKEHERFAFGLAQKESTTTVDKMEEARVRGQDGLKIVLFDLKHLEEQAGGGAYASHKEALIELRDVAVILRDIVDRNDELCVSLTLYEHIKDLAALDFSHNLLKVSLL